uniref:Fumarylacetoacetate hydrolase n=1 Tax=Rhizophora mucronata TaxID=61149 RepID=A0A2P2LIG8_RHIMU
MGHRENSWKMAMKLYSVVVLREMDMSWALGHAWEKFFHHYRVETAVIPFFPFIMNYFPFTP